MVLDGGAAQQEPLHQPGALEGDLEAVVLRLDNSLYLKKLVESMLQQLQEEMFTHYCSRQRSLVLPGSRHSRNQFGVVGVARGVTQANIGSGPPSVEEGSSSSDGGNMSKKCFLPV
jgi:hypothetical protein